MEHVLRGPDEPARVTARNGLAKDAEDFGRRGGRPNQSTNLGRNDQRFAGPPRQDLGKTTFCKATAVLRSGVDEADAKLKRALKKRQRVMIVDGLI